MNEITSRKVVIICYLLVIGIYTFGGLWGSGQVPHPRKYLGATIAYMALAVASDFVAPVAGAMAILFALYILVHNMPSVSAITGGATVNQTQMPQSVNAATAPSTVNPDTPTGGGKKHF